MSNWINWRMAIVRDRQLSFGAKGLALYLNTFMNDRQDVAWPSIATICGEMSVSNKTAIKYINELTDGGWLAKQKRFGTSTLYHVLVPSCVDLTVMEELHRSSGESTPAVVENLHTNKQENKQENKQGNAREALSIPGLDESAWLEYVEHRKEIKARTLKPRSVEKLQDWLAKQEDQQAIVDQTIRNGYTGLFELKGKLNGTNLGSHRKSAAERNADLHNYLDRKIAGTA